MHMIRIEIAEQRHDFISTEIVCFIYNVHGFALQFFAIDTSFLYAHLHLNLIYLPAIYSQNR